MKRFGLSSYIRLVGRLTKLQQKTTIQEYRGFDNQSQGINPGICNGYVYIWT